MELSNKGKNLSGERTVGDAVADYGTRKKLLTLLGYPPDYPFESPLWVRVNTNTGHPYSPQKGPYNWWAGSDFLGTTYYEPEGASFLSPTQSRTLKGPDADFWCNWVGPRLRNLAESTDFEDFRINFIPPGT